MDEWQRGSTGLLPRGPDGTEDGQACFHLFWPVSGLARPTFHLPMRVMHSGFGKASRIEAALA
jgi:hypothetical protein